MNKKQKKLEKDKRTFQILIFAKKRLTSEKINVIGLKKNNIFCLYKQKFNNTARNDYLKRHLIKIQKPKINYNTKKWAEIRKLVFERDLKCRGCDSVENLECHHSYYIENREVWNYPLYSFITLCNSCHAEFHKKIKGYMLVIRNKIKLKQTISEEESNGFYFEKNI